MLVCLLSPTLPSKFCFILGGADLKFLMYGFPTKRNDKKCPTMPTHCCYLRLMIRSFLPNQIQEDKYDFMTHSYFLYTKKKQAACHYIISSFIINVEILVCRAARQMGSSMRRGNYYSRVTFHINMIYVSHFWWSPCFLSNLMPLLTLLIIQYYSLARPLPLKMIISICAQDPGQIPEIWVISAFNFSRL